MGKDRNRDLCHISLLKKETSVSDSIIGGKSITNLITQLGLGGLLKISWLENYCKGI